MVPYILPKLGELTVCMARALRFIRFGRQIVAAQFCYIRPVATGLGGGSGRSDYPPPQSHQVHFKGIS